MLNTYAQLKEKSYNKKVPRMVRNLQNQISLKKKGIHILKSQLNHWQRQPRNALKDQLFKALFMQGKTEQKKNKTKQEANYRDNKLLWLITENKIQAVVTDGGKRYVQFI